MLIPILVLASGTSPTPAPTFPNASGRVIKGKYPYWKPRFPEYHPQPYVENRNAIDDEEFAILAAIDLDE